MTTILPANAATTVIGMYPANDTDPGSSPVKVWQVQVRAPNSTATQEWLTAFDLSTAAASVATASAVTVTSGAATGGLLATASGNDAVLFKTGAPGTTLAGSIKYTVPAVATTPFITELPSNSGYSVAVVVDGVNHDITVTPTGHADNLSERRTELQRLVLLAWSVRRIASSPMDSVVEPRRISCGAKSSVCETRSR